MCRLLMRNSCDDRYLCNLPLIFFVTKMKMFTLLVSFMTISVSVEGSIMAKCDPEKPTGCEVRPIDNPDYAIQQLEKSLVIATPNLTVYLGQTVVFRFEVDCSIPPMDFSPVAYINGCQDNKRCTLLESPSVLVCTIDNVTLADDGMEVSFYSFSHSLLARLCYDPPSYLTVLGEYSVSVTVSIVRHQLCVCVHVAPITCIIIRTAIVLW